MGIKGVDLGCGFPVKKGRGTGSGRNEVLNPNRCTFSRPLLIIYYFM